MVFYVILNTIANGIKSYNFGRPIILQNSIYAKKCCYFLTTANNNVINSNFKKIRTSDTTI